MGSAVAQGDAGHIVPLMGGDVKQSIVVGTFQCPHDALTVWHS